MEYSQFKKLLLTYGAIYFPHALIQLEKLARVDKINRIISDVEISPLEKYIETLKEYFIAYRKEFDLEDDSKLDLTGTTQSRIEYQSSMISMDLQLVYASALHNGKKKYIKYIPR